MCNSGVFVYISLVLLNACKKYIHAKTFPLIVKMVKLGITIIVIHNSSCAAIYLPNFMVSS